MKYLFNEKEENQFEFPFDENDYLEDNNNIDCDDWLNIPTPFDDD